MNELVLKEGAVVAVLSGFTSDHVTRRTVARVLKRYLELDDGSKWDFSGYGYGRSRGSYYPSRIEPWAAKHDVTLKRQRFRVMWDAVKPGLLTDEQIREATPMVTALYRATKESQ